MTFVISVSEDAKVVIRRPSAAVIGISPRPFASGRVTMWATLPTAPLTAPPPAAVSLMASSGLTENPVTSWTCASLLNFEV